MSDTSPPLEVRPFTTADRAALVELWARVFPDDPPHNAPQVMIDDKLANSPEQLLVGYEDGELVAAVIAGYDGTRGWIYHLAVDPSRRRRGHGAAMLRAAERVLADAGCSKVNLQVRSDNDAVITFYEALGYTVEDRVSMGRHLGRPR